MSKPIAILIACVVLTTGASHAVDVASRIVGYNVVDCPAGSDTIVSVPFHRPASFSGAVSGTVAVNGSSVTITPKATPVFAAGEFSNESHYVQFVGGGARAGWVFPVSSHDTATITVDSGGEDLLDLVDGDRFEVIPFWTLETLFPKATQTAIHVSTNKLSTGRKSRILFFDDSRDGIELAPDEVFFLTADGWFRSSAGLPLADDVLIPPGKAFVIRHPATEAATKFIPHQMVVESSYSAPLRSRSGGPQDNAVGLVRPVPVKLSDLDLDATSFVDSASNNPGDRADELLVYDNVAAAINKQPATTYFRVGGVWKKDDGATYPTADDDEISPSTGLVIRKASTVSDETLQWLNTPRYR